MKKNKLIAYAMDFVSFITQKQGTKDIKQIILFGSTARGTATGKSDIDIFVDTNKKELEKSIKKWTDSFYNSRKYNNYWKLIGIKNEIKCMVGKLEEWDLHRSIISEGIVLYGTYTGEIKGKTYSLFTVSIQKKRNEQVKHWRKLYGYKQKIGKKVYETGGIIKGLGGKKISSGIIIVPSHSMMQLKKYLDNNKIKYKLIEMSSDINI